MLQDLNGRLSVTRLLRADSRQCPIFYHGLLISLEQVCCHGDGVCGVETLGAADALLQPTANCDSAIPCQASLLSRLTPACRCTAAAAAGGGCDALEYSQ